MTGSHHRDTSQQDIDHNEIPAVPPPTKGAPQKTPYAPSPPPPSIDHFYGNERRRKSGRKALQAKEENVLLSGGLYREGRPHIFSGQVDTTLVHGLIQGHLYCKPHPMTRPTPCKQALLPLQKQQFLSYCEVPGNSPEFE